MLKIGREEKDLGASREHIKPYRSHQGGRKPRFEDEGRLYREQEGESGWLCISPAWVAVASIAATGQLTTRKARIGLVRPR